MAVKILCIEDEFFISELYARALNKAGYMTTVCMNGSDGLELARTGKYDIILLDIMLPGTNGVEILRALRNTALTPGLTAKIIITTNLDQGDEARVELEKLADGYIVKADITPKELVIFLQTVIPPNGTPPAAAPPPTPSTPSSYLPAQP